MIAKSTVIKDRGGKSGGRAVKAVDLTSGDLRCVSATRLSSPQGDLTAAQKSAEGIVGGTSFAEGLNVGRTLEHGDLGPAMRPNSRYLAFGATGMGEARTALLEGTEAGARGSIIRAAGVGVKDRQRSIQRTAVYGPVCTVVWEGRSREAPPYPDYGRTRAG
jgi:hypothetical protein